MELIIDENVVHTYAISKDLIPTYKKWADKNNAEISKQSFWTFLLCNYIIDDFEINSNTIELDIENFDEFINQ